jgi:hypothetical protein
MRPVDQQNQNTVETTVSFNIDIIRMHETWPLYFNYHGNYIEVTDRLYTIYPDIFGEVRGCKIYENGNINFDRQCHALGLIGRLLLQEYLIELKSEGHLR